MAQLYSLRATQTPGEWLVKKLDGDYNCTAEYLVTRNSCSGPDGQLPNCKHRQMLEIFLGKQQVNTGAFLDWDTRMFHRPLVNPGPLPDDPEMDNTIPRFPQGHE